MCRYSVLSLAFDAGIAQSLARGFNRHWAMAAQDLNAIGNLLVVEFEFAPGARAALRLGLGPSRCIVPATTLSARVQVRKPCRFLSAKLILPPLAIVSLAQRRPIYPRRLRSPP